MEKLASETQHPGGIISDIIRNKLRNLFNYILNDKIFYAIIFILFIFSMISQYKTFMNYDVSSHSYFAKQMLEGKLIHVDIIDPNPPLIFYLHLIPNILSPYLNVSSLNIFIFMVYVLILLSLVVCSRIASLLYDNKIILRGISLSVLFTLAIYIRSDFGQREHLLLILTMPYIFSVAARASDTALKPTLAILIGIMGGIGVCLKPYFLFVPIFLETYLIVYKRRILSFLNISTITILIFLISYVSFVYFHIPDYINFVVPYLLEVYKVFNVPSIFHMLPALWIFLIIIPFLLLHRGISKDSIVISLLITTIALAFSFILQMKPWHYHRVHYWGASFLLTLVMTILWVEGKYNEDI